MVFSALVSVSPWVHLGDGLANDAIARIVLEEVGLPSTSIDGYPSPAVNHHETSS